MLRRRELVCLFVEELLSGRWMFISESIGVFLLCSVVIYDLL